jgi:hypothetical protein
MTGTSFARVGSTLLCSVLLVAACGGSGDSALPEGVTAVAGQDTLKQQQLEQLLVAAPEPPTLDDARSLVHSWVNFALVGDALDRDPTLAQYQEDATRTNLNAHAIRDYANLRKETGREATDAEIDSILRSNTVRSFDVYAIHGDPRVDSVAFIDGIRLLERLRDASIANGGDVAQAFSGLTRAEQDRFDLVRMPAVSRSELPGNLADQLWPLGVGEITQVIAGGPGVQIFTRRNTADFRADVARWLKPRIQAREDLALVDSIVDAHGFKLVQAWRNPELFPEMHRSRLGTVASSVPTSWPSASAASIPTSVPRWRVRLTPSSLPRSSSSRGQTCCIRCSARKSHRSGVRSTSR